MSVLHMAKFLIFFLVSEWERFQLKEFLFDCGPNSLMFHLLQGCFPRTILLHRGNGKDFEAKQPLFLFLCFYVNIFGTQLAAPLRKLNSNTIS
jgi:hypothetical protein